MNRHPVLTGAVAGTILLAGIVSAHASEVTGTLQAGGVEATNPGTGNLNGTVTGGTTLNGSVTSGAAVSAPSGGGFAGIGFSSGGGSAPSAPASGGPAVAASDSPSSCETVDQYIAMGKANDPAQVSRLQDFLNRFDSAGLTVNGNFDQATMNAVKAFQAAHAGDVLAPWGITQPTGNVYLTTVHELNSLSCGTDLPMSSTAMSVIAAYRSGDVVSDHIARAASHSGTASGSAQASTASSASANGATVAQAQADTGISAPGAPEAGGPANAPSNQTASVFDAIGGFWNKIVSSIKNMF